MRNDEASERGFMAVPQGRVVIQPEHWKAVRPREACVHGHPEVLCGDAASVPSEEDHLRDRERSTLRREEISA
jgi:hypothetical protein